MKKILVPTDFSDNALIAANYAASIAQQQKYSLHVVHYYTAKSSRFEESELTEELAQSNLLKADITIKEWVGKLQAQHPNLPISYHNDRGLLEETLPKEAKREEYIAVVMGTTGASGDKNIFWGSNASAIAAKSPIPVIAVPNTVGNADLTQVGLLTNFKQEELTTLQEFLHIFKQDIHLRLVHVYKESEDLEEVINTLESWSFNIGEFSAVKEIETCIAPIVKEDKYLDTVPEVISKLIEENNIDLILISKSRKSFFQRLFTPSVSKAMALKLTTPAFFGKTI